jgi:hypothetical protein
MAVFKYYISFDVSVLIENSIETTEAPSENPDFCPWFHLRLDENGPINPRRQQGCGNQDSELL